MHKDSFKYNLISLNIMEVRVVAKKWGSSLAVIIPKSVADSRGIRENDEVVLDIKKQHSAGEFFGLASEWKEGSQKIKDEMRKQW
jgi:hypothetical protein